MGKGEIARYEQFLLFPPCFQKLSVVRLKSFDPCQSARTVQTAMSRYLVANSLNAVFYIAQMCVSIRFEGHFPLFTKILILSYYKRQHLNVAYPVNRVD